jgi:hypothetical protein
MREQCAAADEGSDIVVGRRGLESSVKWLLSSTAHKVRHVLYGIILRTKQLCNPRVI